MYDIECERRATPIDGWGARQPTYQPPHFREDRLAVQHALIRAHPLGLLITDGSDGLVANPVPFLIDAGRSPKGTLRAHLARANLQWRNLEAVDTCLVVFQGPQDYVTPSWYATKQETGKVVPTWNYVTVQAWGGPRVVEDAGWLRQQIEDLTRAREASRAVPWDVADAPEAFVAAQICGIVGVEIAIDRIGGKWKLGQNRSEADRRGVIGGYRAMGPSGRTMADLVAERSDRDEA